MHTYSDFVPTAFDRNIPFRDERDTWFVAPCSQTRDSDALTRANFRALQDMLDDAGMEYEVHRFGHWGPGWFEILIVKPSDDARAFLEKVAKDLDDYPVLSEEEASAEEAEEAEETWRFAGMRCRIQYVRDAGLSIFAARREVPPAECYPFLVRGY